MRSGRVGDGVFERGERTSELGRINATIGENRGNRSRSTVGLSNLRVALGRLRSLLADDETSGIAPRANVQARGYYLNILI